MPVSVRSSGTWKTPIAMWVRSGGTWKRISRVHGMSSSGWTADDPIPLATPTISVVSGTYNGSPPLLLLTPGASGGGTSSYVLKEYRYDASGSAGSRTLASSTTGSWTDAGVTVLRSTNPPAGTKISYEVQAVGLNGTLSAAATVRWKIGADAVTVQTPNYGWGTLPDWTDPSDYFILTATTPSSGAAALTKAYDSQGNSTFYEANPTGGIQADALNDGVELMGNGFLVGSATLYPGTVTLTWSSPTKRRLDEVRVAYRGRVGYVGSLGGEGIVSRGKSSWTITGMTGTDKTAVCEGNYTGPLAATAGAVVWTGLNRERDDGYAVPVRCVKPPYYGVYGTESFSRLAVFDIKVKVREWAILSYTTTVVTPAVAGQPW